MIDNELDNETVAAFLDGTLPEAERARVMQLLAASPALHREVLEAAKVSAELHGDNRALQLAARPNRRQRRVMVAIPFLAAAGIAGVLLMRRDNPPDVLMLARSANLTSERGAGSIDRALGSAWDQPGWAVVRGGEASAGAGTAARIGARVAQLEFAASASDSVAYHRVALALAEALTAIDGAGPVAERLRSDGIPTADARTTSFSQLRQLSASASAFDLGAWLETARLAGQAQNTEFFAEGSAALSALRAILDAADANTQLSRVIQLARPLQNGMTASALPQSIARIDSAMAAIPR